MYRNYYSCNSFFLFTERIEKDGKMKIGDLVMLRKSGWSKTIGLVVDLYHHPTRQIVHPVVQWGTDVSADGKIINCRQFKIPSMYLEVINENR